MSAVQAEEMAKLRAPGAMCLRFLWEVGLDSFEPVIERVLAATLARTSRSSSPASKQASRPGSGTASTDGRRAGNASPST